MIAVEYIQDGIQHSECNAATIAALLLQNPNDKIHFFAGKEHYYVVLKILQDNGFNTSNIILQEIKPINKSMRDYQYIPFQINILKKILKFSKENNDYNILFLLITPIILYFIKFHCFINKKLKIRCFMHGTLEKVDLKDYTLNSKANNIQTFLYLLFFGFRVPLILPCPKNLKYIILGNSIAKNLIKLIPKIKKEIITINLPFLYNYNTVKNNHSDIINFGIIGICNPLKNTKNLIPLIEKLKEIKNKNFKLFFAGKIADENLYNLAENTDFIYKKTLSKDFLDNETKNNTIKNVDYALFTYDIGKYKYTASLALLEAINFEKPIIALVNHYIKDYFDRYGNIGYLCNTYEELEEKMLQILNRFPKEDYEIQVENLKKIKQAENVQFLSKIF